MRVERFSKVAFAVGVASLMLWTGACKKRVAVPPPMNQPPAASCSAASSSVRLGSVAVNVTANATDPNNDALTYAWSATGGAIEGSGSSVRWNPAGLSSGSYTISARVSDPKGEVATCNTSISIQPNAAPTVSCSTDRSSVLAGERVSISATANDAEGDRMNYTWRTTGGQIVGSGSTVQLDTSGLSGGTYTVTGRVEDARGGASDCTTKVAVSNPPPPPQASKVNEIMYRQGSATVDNVGKRILDDVATRLNADPSASVVLIGYADPKESAKLAARRAEEAAKYLASKGVSSSRINQRTGTGEAGGGKANRRVDIIWVPANATF